MDNSNPMEVKIAGTRVPIDEEAYKKWAIAAAKRILFFSQMQPQRFEIDGRLAIELDMRGIIAPNPDGHGTTIKLDEPGLKRRGELVGLGGSFFLPWVFGAKDADQAIESWNWLFSQATVPKQDLEFDLEMMYVLGFISRGIGGPEIFRIMGLATDLKQLHDMGVDVRRKVSEINQKIAGNVRAFKRLKDKRPAEAMFRIMELTYELSDLSAESRLALIAKINGMDVKMGKSPDLFIDGVRVEVKFDRRDEMDAGAFVNKLRKGFAQGGNLIVILTGDFRTKKIEGLNLTWMPMNTLNNLLKMAVKAAKNRRKCILLYTGTNKGYLGRLALLR